MNNNVIIFPTDTVYGIGCSVYSIEGIKKIYEIKHRPLNKPLAVLCCSLEQIKTIAYVSEDAQKLIEAFLPGPLTIILKAKDKVKASMGFDSVGIRIPNYQLACSILKENGPMATTSVNESGQTALNEYNEIKEKYDDLVDAIYPPSGESTSSVASTVIIYDNKEWKLIRLGAISMDQIKKVLTK